MPLRRAFGWGFLVGALILVPVIALFLLVPIPQAIVDILTPGTLLLRPMADQMAGWPGAINVTLSAVANGFVYGAVAMSAAAILRLFRR